MEALLQKCLAIRSDVAADRNEKDFAEFLENELKKINGVSVQREEVKDGRFNIFVSTPGPAEWLFTAHLDTVQLSNGWTKDPFGKTKEGDKIYGLGAADTKASIVIFLTLLKKLSEENRINNIAALFYCDEEYHFAGMKTFLKNRVSQAKPEWKMIIAGEPTGEAIAPAFRGCIEAKISVFGKSGHAARPESGQSASKGLLRILEVLQAEVEKQKNRVLGGSVINITGLKSGIREMMPDGQYVLKSPANVIPDYAEAVVDIRTVQAEFNGNKLKEICQKNIGGEDMILCEVLLDFAPLITKDEEKVKDLIAAFKDCGMLGALANPSQRGYVDVAMLADAFSVPTVILGPVGGNIHGLDEWVSIKSMERIRNALYKYLTQENS